MNRYVCACQAYRTGGGRKRNSCLHKSHHGAPYNSGCRAHGSPWCASQPVYGCICSRVTAGSCPCANMASSLPLLHVACCILHCKTYAAHCVLYCVRYAVRCIQYASYHCAAFKTGKAGPRLCMQHVLAVYKMLLHAIRKKVYYKFWSGACVSCAAEFAHLPLKH